MLAVKVLPKGQITLPKEVRQQLHIQVGDTLLMDADGDRVVFRKGKTIFDFKGVLPSRGMTIDEIREKVYEEKNIKFADAVMAFWGMEKGIATTYTYDEKDFKRIDGLTVLTP